MNLILTKIKNLVKENYFEVIVILLIIVIACFLRFYKLSEYMTFLGDEGRDALMIQRILITFDIPLIGPPSSVGNVYLGPLYYYMMSVPMAIFWLNPIAASFMNALIGVLVVLLIYYLARIWFGLYPAILASTLYSISPITINSSRSSWNPNPLPFFVLIGIFGMFKLHQSKDFRWLILVGGALAFALQMHYLALILLPMFILVYLYEVFLDHNLEQKKYLYMGTSLAILIFCFLMSPLVIFDFKHDFINYRGLQEIFFGKSSSGHFSFVDSVLRIIPIYKDNLIGRYMVVGNTLLTYLMSILIFIPIGWTFWWKIKKRFIDWSYLFLVFWILFGLFGLSILKIEIYDHYLNIINPAPYFLLAGLIGFVKKMQQQILIIILLLVIAPFNLAKGPFLNPPNMQLQRTQNISSFIIEKTNNKPFNFALIAERNYDSAYQFILSIEGHKAKALPDDMTDQLFVVCEDLICDPTHNSKYEITAFGWSKIEKEYEVSGVKIFKLVHNPTGQP